MTTTEPATTPEQQQPFWRAMFASLDNANYRRYISGHDV